MNKKIKSFKNYSTPDKVNFQVVEGDVKLNKDTLKLVSTLSTSNMVLFVDDNKLQKFKNIYDILGCFIEKRYNLYVLRKKSILQNLSKQLNDLEVQHSFIKSVVMDEIIIFKKSNDDIYKQKSAWRTKLTRQFLRVWKIGASDGDHGTSLTRSMVRIETVNSM